MRLKLNTERPVVYPSGEVCTAGFLDMDYRHDSSPFVLRPGSHARLNPFGRAMPNNDAIVLEPDHFLVVLTPMAEDIINGFDLPPNALMSEWAGLWREFPLGEKAMVDEFFISNNRYALLSPGEPGEVDFADVVEEYRKLTLEG